jgi:succinyl-diaminopimelate desuccinylase
LAAHSQHRGSIAFLLTSDEEGPSVDGTAKVIKYLQKRDEQIDLCLLAEPSSMERVGDSVKNGRRGSLTGHLLVNGIQGHVAYPQKADNPIHRSIPFLQALNSVKWDQGNEFFPPTSFQITNIHAGTGADNVIPSKLELLFNFRYSTEVTHTQLQQQVKTLLEQHGVKYHLTWHHSGVPFLTMPGNLVKATQQAIKEICGYETQLSTAGGTSDGRFIAPTGAQLVELGPINATIHQINECVNIADLDILTIIYQRILEKLLLEKT